MADRVKQVAAAEAENIKWITQEAGIFYFVSHKDLWKPLTSKMAPTITLSVGVTTLMFIVAYVPQAAVMAFTSGPVAAISAAILTLSESSTLINLLSRTFLIEEALVDTFDGTLLSRDCTNLVKEGRQIKAGGDNIARLGKLLKRPFAKFTPNAIIRYLLYLPLNFIPVVGTLIFIALQGKRAGPAAHTRYFQLKEWNRKQREMHIAEHRGGYTAFGVAAFLLEMIPLQILFSPLPIPWEQRFGLQTLKRMPRPLPKFVSSLPRLSNDDCWIHRTQTGCQKGH
ncbi:uncharacterized protein Z519_10831 [Cladophialophora bantiana CBS 173.52]|uniref:Outer spore wall protein RRT8 n=1 Tax=Cladophialophora bantiana (strain ATCC 10958 / CBS 173.52 / CDC B-1940 / NIH 8579) TaxID=1442370 RepID=A0A0D2HW24_CLAB1|nr:uncharacterized protein Z519_10831 [Cladophialophora bantiana CBS 173.52]KIW88784.1 hypothetical protein Z519_10831 [Cladophialophora bantiana CBS 173.52]